MTLLSMTRGDLATYRITLTDRDTGEPIDLGQVDEITFTAKSDTGDPDDDAVIVKTIGDGIELDDYPETGLATLTITPDDTETLLGWTMLVWDLQVDNGNGDVRTPLRGHLEVTADVSLTSSASGS